MAVAGVGDKAGRTHAAPLEARIGPEAIDEAAANASRALWGPAWRHAWRWKWYHKHRETTTT